MIRLHELWLSVAAAGFAGLLIISGGTASRDQGWDPARVAAWFSRL